MIYKLDQLEFVVLRLLIIFFELTLIFQLIFFFENSRSCSEYCYISQKGLIQFETKKF